MSHRITSLALLLALLVCAACAAPAPTTMPLVSEAPATLSPADAKAAEELEAFFANLAKDDQFSGAVLIARGDTIILRKGYGYADQVAQIPNTPETMFQIGDGGRPFVAAAILLLESQGKLSVQDSICKYVADCPPAWEPVTLHHLLTCTSGMTNYMSVPAFANIDKTTVKLDELVALLREHPYSANPTMVYEYLNQSHYLLLATVIERVTGQPFAQFLQEQFFTPLEMTHTGYGLPPTGMAIGYARHLTPASKTDLTAALAADGLHSTIDDLYRWDRALMADKALPPAQRDMMFQKQTHAFDDWDFSYGYALNDTINAGHHMVFSGFAVAAFPGYRHVNWMVPDAEVVVVVLHNQDTGSYDDINYEISTQLFGE